MEVLDKKNYSNYQLHQDLTNRCIYVGGDGHIFLETNSLYYKEVTDFLIAIGEPVHRTQNMHEYMLTMSSLYAAASMNIKSDDIILILTNLSKNELPKEVKDLIKAYTETYGKAKLILKNKRYFIDCSDLNIKAKILNIDLVHNSREKMINLKKYAKSIEKKNTIIETQSNNQTEADSLDQVIGNLMKEDEKIDKDDIPSNNDKYFEIHPDDWAMVKKACEKEIPLIEEYEFKNDKTNANMDILPKLQHPMRAYQEKALSIMFSNERARSGIIVLPCGAGKTLVGIMAAVTMKKNTIILCNSSVSVNQWAREFRSWTILKPEKNIVKFTSKGKKEDLWETDKTGGVLVTTYTMMAYEGNRNEIAKKKLDTILQTEWGLMILDEVQVVPAEMFRKIMEKKVKSHCKLGLTATLVREDKKIDDLHFLIGPKHYEANWLDLQNDGYLARVKCIEIWTEMEVNFYEEYLKSESRKKAVLYVANPNKYFICKALVDFHKNDKIIIFSDNLYCLEQYARELCVPFISGKVPEKERQEYLDDFREANGRNCIVMSKVGDTSLDLPNANVIIQISSHFGSRRQEAQRLGRILRPKKDNISEFNAFFYSIVSKNTEEMYFSNKRHKFLVDQGYCFKVITDLKDIGVPEVMDEQSKNEYLSKTLLKIRVTNIRVEDEKESIDMDYVDNEVDINKIDENIDQEEEESNDEMEIDDEIIREGEITMR